MIITKWIGSLDRHLDKNWLLISHGELRCNKNILIIVIFITIVFIINAIIIIFFAILIFDNIDSLFIKYLFFLVRVAVIVEGSLHAFFFVAVIYNAGVTRHGPGGPVSCRV